MDAFTLVLMLNVLFHFSCINGQEVKLSFHTSVYEGSKDNYAHIGEDVILTCAVPNAETRVNMYEGMSTLDCEILVPIANQSVV